MQRREAWANLESDHDRVQHARLDRRVCAGKLKRFGDFESPLVKVAQNALQLLVCRLGEADTVDGFHCARAVS